MKFKQVIDQFSVVLEDTISILYPNLCAACDEFLVKGEKVICIKCMLSLPRTNYHKFKNNRIAKQFWGLIILESATAFFYFNKATKVQKLLHRLKYDSRPEIGEAMGQLCGNELKLYYPYNSVDLIVPVPLHRRKQQLRGYNQSAMFGKGLSIALQIPQLEHALLRKKNSKTQTRKNKEDRYNNVKEAFEINPKLNLENKHILLVDDVITTGGTLLSCTKQLQQWKGIKISIVAIAFTN